MKHDPDRIAAWLLIALAAIIAFDSRRLEVLPVGPGTLPMLVAVLLAVVAGQMLVRSVCASPDGASRRGLPLSVVANPLYVAACIALYILALTLAGYLISTFLLVLGMLARLSNYHITRMAALALLVSLISYYTFTKLGMRLPAAWIEAHLP